jgi:hypothetical protein
MEHIAPDLVIWWGIALLTGSFATGCCLNEQAGLLETTYKNTYT